MQTQRVTFLTSAEHKAALDAFAARSGQSVGNVVREATVRYLQDGAEDEEHVAALVQQVNEAIPKMEAALDEMSRKMRETHIEVDAMLRSMGARA